MLDIFNEYGKITTGVLFFKINKGFTIFGNLYNTSGQLLIQGLTFSMAKSLREDFKIIHV
jgi:hypothetical protein